MTTSATDNGGDQQLSTVNVPHIESLEELDAHFEQTYGPDVLRTLKDSNLDQAAMVQELHKYGLNGRSEAVERTYRLHQQEFARKETLLGTTWRWTKNTAGFAADVVSAPFRWTWQSFKSHPILTTVGIAAIIVAILYFTGPLAPTAGDFGAGLIESFKGVLAKVGVAVPEVAVDATAAVPVTGDVASQAVAEQAAASFASPGEGALLNAGAAANANAATGAAEAALDLTDSAAESIFQSPEAAEAIRKAAEATGITDPAQRIFNNLPPGP